MKIVAASILAKVTGFLHAGYISGFPDPHGLAAGAFGTEPPLVELELGKALQLKSEWLARAAELSGSTHGGFEVMGGHGSVVVADSVHPLWYALGIVAVAGLLAAFYVFRSRFGLRARWWAVPAAAAMAVALLIGLTGEFVPRAPPLTATIIPRLTPPMNTAAPAAAGDRRAASSPYADPRAATLALLHGLIAGALINNEFVTRSFGELSTHARFPHPVLSKGQRYALDHIDRDGWDRPWQFEVKGDMNPYAYVVTSLGADGQPDTADDLKLEVAQTTAWTWSRERHSYFLVRDGEGLLLLFRQAPGGSFVARNPDRAKAYTESDLFDALTPDQLSAEQRSALQQAWEAHLSSARQEERVVLLVPPPPAMAANTSYRYARVWGYRSRRSFEPF